jgi:hypothetical protein
MRSVFSLLKYRCCNYFEFICCVLLTKCYSGDKMKKTQMGRTCRTCGGEEGHTGFWWGNLRERDHLEDPGIDGMIILNWIFEKWLGEGRHWIDLTQDRCWAFVNAVMNLQVP